MMRIALNLNDQAMKRFGAQLEALGKGGAAKVMARALNHEGDKVRTQVRTAISKQTGILKGRLNLITHGANESNLTYTLTTTGRETNVAAYKGRQVEKGVSAAPWGNRRIFEKAFMLKSKKGVQGAVGAGTEGGTLLAFIRKPGERKKLHPLYGPNLARELIKDESKEAFERNVGMIVDRIGHEIGFLIGASH
jgi:hypothetical protein